MEDCLVEDEVGLRINYALTRRAKVAKKAEVKMPHNALRHSFCTYHVALKGDAGKTATLLMQRGDVSILYEHYKGNATNADAKDFFGIVPKK